MALGRGRVARHDGRRGLGHRDDEPEVGPGSVAIATMTAVREFGGGGLKRGGGISRRGGRSRAMRNVERTVGV
uniref:DUF834 domain-containing protein n=1 Tax=Oryza glumipatula TaxID=40148 RepID=A0A0E0ANW1_9ORYZ